MYFQYAGEFSFNLGIFHNDILEFLKIQSGTAVTGLVNSFSTLLLSSCTYEYAHTYNVSS